jgi:hypothetical protein
MKAKLFFKTVVFFVVLLLFAVINSEMVLDEPFQDYEEYIVMDQSDDFDVLRVADIDTETLSYGFYASRPYTLMFKVDGEVIKTITYDSDEAIEISLDANDGTSVLLTASSGSVSKEVEFMHIESFDTYRATLFADQFETTSINETLLVERSMFLGIWERGLSAQLITVVIVVVLYGFFLGTPKCLVKIKQFRFNKWVKWIVLHLIGSVAIYGVIIFLLVLFWGEEDTSGLYDSTSLYEARTELYDLSVTLGITKVNGLSKEALEVIYMIDLKEHSDSELIGQLYCNEDHVQSVYAYRNQLELEHIATDIYIKDDCRVDDVLRLDIYDNQTGFLIDSIDSIPLVVESEQAMNEYGLSYNALGTIFSISVFAFSALVLMPLLEYADHRYHIKRNNKEQGL